MKSRLFSGKIVSTLMLIVLVFGLALVMNSSTAAPVPGENAPFKGKVVVVTLEDKHSLPLEHPEIRKLGDRSYLVGKGSDEGHPANWTKGQRVRIPINRVEIIVEFENLEAMKKSWAEYQKNAPASPPGNIH